MGDHLHRMDFIKLAGIGAAALVPSPRPPYLSSSEN